MPAATSFDYLIVGAGSTGCALAARLAEDPDCRVLLIEQGPPNTSLTVRIPGFLRENFKPNRPYMRWYPTVAQRHMDGRVIEHPRGVGLGGSSLVNGMTFLRGNAEDYERWVREGARGWAYADVLPCFKRMECRAEGADAYRGDAGPVGVRRQQRLHPLNEVFLEAGRQAGFPFTGDVNGAVQEGFCRFDMNADRRGYRASAYYAYIERQPRKPNLTIWSGVAVLRVLVEHGRAVGVACVRDGERRELRAEREVIVSAGAVGSPWLLLLSGIGPADHLRTAGVTPVHDLPGVGANLHDHLELDLQWECRQPIALNGMLRPHRMALAGLQWLLFGTGVAAGSQCHVGAFLRSAPEVPHPDIQFHFFPVCFDGWVPRADRHGFRVSAGPLRQTSRGTLRLRSADPREAPAVDPNYLATERDRTELRECYRLIREVVAQKAFDPYRGAPLEPGVLPESVTEVDALVRRMAATGFHLCGTCAMGASDDPMAVVDPETRVRGLEGLRIADASIMPSIVSSNLNAPAMMIGERAAALIKGHAQGPTTCRE